MSFSQFWSLKSPRWRHQKMWRLVRIIFWFINDTFLLCLHMVDGVNELSGAYFIRELILFMKASSSSLITFQMAPTPNEITLGIRISVYEHSIQTTVAIKYLHFTCGSRFTSDNNTRIVYCYQFLKLFDNFLKSLL